MNRISYPPGCKDIQEDIPNDELIRRLKKIQQAYQNLEQSSEEKYKELAQYLGSEIFINHEHDDVQLLVACCIADIFRVFAPDSPYDNPDDLKKIFVFLCNQLKGLKNISNGSFNRYFYLLENLECVKTFQLCCDLDESQEIVALLFENIFKIISEKHSGKVKTLFFDLLIPILNETDQISNKLMEIMFTKVIEPQKSNNKEAYNLASNLIKKSGEHFEYYAQNYLSTQILTEKSDNANIIGDKMCLVIYELNALRPSLLELMLPQVEYKLKSNELKERREYTKLLAKMFSEKDSKLASVYPQLWEAYLDRYSDENDEIRKACILATSDVLVNHPYLLGQIMEPIKSRALDTDELLRYEMVQEILKAIKTDSSLIDDDLLGILKDRTLDIKTKVRKAALNGLANLYKRVHSKAANKEVYDKVDWIPSKIMRIHFQDSVEDKLLVERLLNSCIVPYNLNTKDKMAELYYAFTKFDEFSIVSFVDIIKESILLHQSMKTIIDLVDKNDSEDKLNAQIMFVSRHLFEVNKAQELMKALVKLFKENLNLKSYFKSLVNPNCSCAKAMELISLILSNLANGLTPTNLSMAKSLIERMSSIIFDDEILSALFDILDLKIFETDKDKQYDHIDDTGEKGLQLISIIVRTHTHRYTPSVCDRLLAYFKCKKNQIISSTLKILANPPSKTQLNSFTDADLKKLDGFIINGTAKQAKYAIKAIYTNQKDYPGILNRVYKQLKLELETAGNPNFVAHLVSLGHLAYHIPTLIGLDMKNFIGQNVIKDLLLPLSQANTQSESSYEPKNNSLSKLAGKWCENDDELPIETRSQIEGIKLVTRWCLGLKTECPSVASTLKLLTRLINEQNDLDEYKDKSEPEKARIRLVCANQILKLAQEPCFKTFILPDQYHTIARLIIDPVASVRDNFVKKLQKGLKTFRLSMSYMAIFILSGLDQNRERKARVKKIICGLVKLFRESNKKIQSTTVNQQQLLKAKNLPEYALSLAISLLAHNCKIDSLKDEVAVKQIKDALSSILDPLLENPDGHVIAFLKKLLGTIKNTDDGLASSVLSHSKDRDQLTAANQLMSVNKKLQTICEIAFFLIHSKIAHNVSKDYPYDIELPAGFFTEKTNLDPVEPKPNSELETTLTTIDDCNTSSNTAKSASSSAVNSPNGKSRKRTSKEAFAAAASDDEPPRNVTAVDNDNENVQPDTENKTKTTLSPEAKTAQSSKRSKNNSHESQDPPRTSTRYSLRKK